MLSGLAGVAVWPLYSFGLPATYSGRAHALVQIYGFLYSFIAGFLLTAVPPFTGTELPSRAAQYTLAAALTVAIVASELRIFDVGTAAFLIAHVMLLGLVALRFARRKQDPPPTFVLIGLGLAAGAAGAIITTGVAWDLIPASLDALGKRLLTEGMVMLLVLGVGGFLGPRLLGFAALPAHGTSVGGDARLPAAAGIVILIALLGEYGFDLSWLAYVRAAVVSAAIVSSLQLW